MTVPLRLIDRLRDFLREARGEVTLAYLRHELKIDPEKPEWESLKQYMRRLSEEKIVKPSGRNDGVYKVIKQVNPVSVFGIPRERRPLFDLKFPRDFDTGMELDFAEHVILREGDLVTMGGVKSMGKTTLCMLFCAENIDKRPVLMGNEYTVSVDGKFEPAPRFFSRLDTMSEWVKWYDENGDRFHLLPVTEDYAEHVVGGKINIIDWINMDANRLYDIGTVLAEIKASLSRGLCIVALQKGEGAVNPRGGQFVRDFSDLEILLDSFGENTNEVLLTIKGCKESRKSIIGRTYAYMIGGYGTQILKFREVVKCPTCYGKGWVKIGNSSKPCDNCHKKCFIDR